MKILAAILILCYFVPMFDVREPVQEKKPEPPFAFDSVDEVVSLLNDFKNKIL